MIEVIAPVRIDIDYVRQKAAEIGKTDLQWNFYQSAVTMYDLMVKEGLDPVILTDPVSRSTYITSEQYLTKKMH